MKLIKLFSENRNSNLKEFAERFHYEVEETTKIAKSCRTREHCTGAERMFELICEKWKTVFLTNNTAWLMFVAEERRFYQELAKVKSKIVLI